jgi:RNA polymerase sigma factor (sigma-70 family)
MASGTSRASGPGPEGEHHGDLTTLHVRRARAGDGESTAWLVQRFGPLLLAQARYRMGPRLLARVDPEDVVQEVWATALPRLGELALREGRATPVMLRFLATAVLHQVNNLLRRAATSERAAGGGATSLVASTGGPLTRASAAEEARRLLAAIDALDERDRELLILRGIEQLDLDEVAAQLGLRPNTCSQAYRRALERLRQRVTAPVLDEL